MEVRAYAYGGMPTMEWILPQLFATYLLSICKKFFLKTKYKDAISLTLYVSPRTESYTAEGGKPSPHNLLRNSLVHKHDWLKSLEGDWFIDVFSALFACLPFLEIFMSEWT